MLCRWYSCLEEKKMFLFPNLRSADDNSINGVSNSKDVGISYLHCLTFFLEFQKQEGCAQWIVSVKSLKICFILCIRIKTCSILVFFCVNLLFPLWMLWSYSPIDHDIHRGKSKDAPNEKQNKKICWLILIPKIKQILKPFTGTFCLAQTFYFWIVFRQHYYFASYIYQKSKVFSYFFE